MYQEATSRTEEFEYDAAGNRKLQRITLIQTAKYDSVYYANSNLLKTDGKYAFEYDAAGNLVAKGNRFTIQGDKVTFTTAGDEVEYWQYEYDLLNRLIRVRKNGTMVSEYGYDPDGLRVVKKAKGETTHYIFEGTEPIFEKRIKQNQIRSYVYALGRHLARVDGALGDTAAKEYFYHTDYLGSVRAVTDTAGKVVYNADYLPFGSRHGENGDFDEEHGFTGKEYDPDTGLYYFNARWYDSELGRFISADPVANPNLYTYCNNNPLVYTDPDGRNPFLIAALVGGLFGGIDAVSNGQDFWSGFAIGAIGGSIGYGFGQALAGTALADALGPIGTQALTGGLTSGTMSVLMGGDFWDGAGTGAISGGVSGWLNNIFPKVDSLKPESKFLAPIRSWFINSLGVLASGKKISGKQILGSTISSILNSTLVFDSKDKDYVKELKALGIEIEGDVVRVEKTQTMEDGVVTTKFEIYVNKDLSSSSLELDKDIKSKNMKDIVMKQSLSVETNNAVIIMNVSVKSTGALTVDVRLGFENKYLTAPYVKVNEKFDGIYSRDTTPGIESVPHMWRRYQWDTTITKDHANLAAGIIYRPIAEPTGNWAWSDEVYVKINLSQYLK